MNGLLSLYKQIAPDEQFDAIKIGIASPEKIRSWLTVRFVRLKPSTIVRLSLNVMVFSAPKDFWSYKRL
ncbi:DNA-directed RNA polymerase subunit beta' [Oligella ureolytica]